MVNGRKQALFRLIICRGGKPTIVPPEGVGLNRSKAWQAGVWRQIARSVSLNIEENSCELPSPEQPGLLVVTL